MNTGSAAGAQVPVLSVSGLTHRFGARSALAGLSFDVLASEVFGLLGPNGSGKSTAIAVLCGLLPLQEGTVRLDGVSLAPTSRRLREQIGVVFQSPSLDPKLTARENLALAATMQAIPRSIARERIEEQLQVARLAERSNEPVGRFSGGMRRRLDIARALLHRPRILLLDEPTAGLDEASFRHTWEHLEAQRRRQELTIVVSTHRPDEAERCSRLAVIAGGRADLIATPLELKQKTSSDLIVLRGADPEAIAARVHEAVGLAGRVEHGEVLVECERGHELVPRIVEAFDPGRLASVSLRHPSLADVFLKLTGAALDGDAAPAREAA
jgi:ABC-2 type transport system ATP-binding protein